MLWISFPSFLKSKKLDSSQTYLIFKSYKEMIKLSEVAGALFFSNMTLGPSRVQKIKAIFFFYFFSSQYAN